MRTVRSRGGESSVSKREQVWRAYDCKYHTDCQRTSPSARFFGFIAYWTGAKFFVALLL